MRHQRSRVRPVAVIALLAAMAVAAPATATTTISSSAYGVSATLTLTSLLTASIDPVAAVSGSAAPAYAETGSVMSLTRSGALGALVAGTLGVGVTSGVVTTSATSTFPATPAGDSSALLTGFDLNFGLKPAIGSTISLLRIRASAIGSSAQVDGSGTPAATGGALVSDLRLSGASLLGGGVTLGTTFEPTADYQLLDVLGLSIVLNEQVRSGDLAASAGITTNALHARFKDFLIGGGLLNGEIVVAHSRAVYYNDGMGGGAVPEPAVWAQMIAGFGAIGAAARRRRAVRAA